MTAPGALGRLIPGLLGLACLAVLTSGVSTRLWPVVVAAFAALAASVAVERWAFGTAFGLLVVALAAVRTGHDSVLLDAAAGLLLGLHLVSLGARDATDWPSLRAWLIHEVPRAGLLVLVVAMVPLGAMLPVRLPVVGVAVGGLSIVLLLWWVRARLRSST